MFVMIVIVVMATGFTNEQRVHPWPSLDGCQAALAAAVNASRGEGDQGQLRAPGVSPLGRLKPYLILHNVYYHK